MQYLPRTTERPVRKRGDECSDLPVRAAPQSHGRKSVVRGLPQVMLGHIALKNQGSDPLTLYARQVPFVTIAGLMKTPCKMLEFGLLSVKEPGLPD